MTALVDQRLMRLAAIEQARFRANREGERMVCFRRVGFPTAEEVTWYVRSVREDEPEGSAVEFVAEPQ